MNSCGQPPGCDTSLDRRGFIKLGAAGALTLLASRMPALAGPFRREDFSRLVPADKKLDPQWVKSLFDRGTPEVWSGEQLKYIGMPVGGICAGQLYLGGTGKLWHWDIFNRTTNSGASGPHYRDPLLPASPVDQGFALNGKPLDQFAHISFRGEYPFGIVTYREKDVEVVLEAFSPFIPLNTDDSSLPATVMRFTVKNTGRQKREIELAGHLSRADMASQIKRGNGFVFLECSSAAGTMGSALLGEGETVTRNLSLAPGQAAVVTFVVTWHFPHLTLEKLPGGRYYATKFNAAFAVAEYVAGNFDRLYRDTKLWRDTWYDSTLPYWFLDRTMLNTSILATSTCHRFKDGRFYGWEGVGCCPGTCGHVWHYAQAVARLFPELERDLRERVDFGLALQPDGAIHFRGEFNNFPAIDAQAGAILRALREHQMTTDRAFLKKNWPGIKRATQWLIQQDADGDGLIEGQQHNTLDADWFGPVAWLSGLYLAALAAAAAMADEMGETGFAQQCRALGARGQKNITEQLFDGEYYINQPDPKHLNTVNSGTGCEIDQVMGQSWAWQVGLPRVFPEKETVAALRSLWKYNFTPDVGLYRQVNKPGRWYAIPGEAGLLMCTFPRSDWDFTKASGNQPGQPGVAGYFNECMTGFEYQVAGHMIREGLVLEGLAITRAVHDRYSPLRRNPYNEIECGDHYARAMASYGVYLAACGFEYHGPNGHIGFAPRLTPTNFKAAFTAAEGWGTFAVQDAEYKIQVRWGKLRLKTIALATAKKPHRVQVTLGHNDWPARFEHGEGKLRICLEREAEMAAPQELRITTA